MTRGLPLLDVFPRRRLAHRCPPAARAQRRSVWTAPRTWSPGELVTALMMNQHVRDNLNYLYTSTGVNGICEGRVTTLTATPVTTTDRLAQTSLFFSPYTGNRLALYSASVWTVLTFAELSISLGTDAANTVYDLFVWNNNGTPTLERLAWTSDTARATGLVLQDGTLVKSGDPTRRFLATYRTTGTVGQTDDSALKRYLWNYYNRITRHLLRQESAANWNYNIATIRQANANAANQVECVIGWNEVEVDAMTQVAAYNATVGTALVTGIGLDSTTTFSGEPGGAQISGGNQAQQITGRYKGFPGVGRHVLSWNELVSVAGGNTTFVATGISGSTSGISAWVAG